MLVHQRHGFLAARAFAHSDELHARRHDVLDRLTEVGFEAQIAVGDNADHPPCCIDHRQPGDLVLGGQVQHVAHGHVLRDRDRILDHTALEALDLGYFATLRARCHVLVDDADAAFLGDRNRETRFGYSVHGGGHQRNIEADRARQLGLEADVARQDFGVGWKQQDIVEGEGFLHHAHLVILRKTVLYASRCKPPSYHLR